jgi:hypothetical protein
MHVFSMRGALDRPSPANHRPNRMRSRTTALALVDLREASQGDGSVLGNPRRRAWLRAASQQVSHTIMITDTHQY